MAVELPRDRPRGSILLRGGRALTMAGGDRMHRRRRYPRHRRPDRRDRPARQRRPCRRARTIRDVDRQDRSCPASSTTTTISPRSAATCCRLEDWGLRARLAYGVTTSFDPSTLSIDMLAYQDLLDAGLMLGPRLRSTGPALFSINRFQSLDEVRARAAAVIATPIGSATSSNIAPATAASGNGLRSPRANSGCCRRPRARSRSSSISARSSTAMRATNMRCRRCRSATT